MALRDSFKSKIEKVPRVIRGEKSSKAWQVRGIWSQQLQHKQIPQWGTEPGVRKGKRSLLVCHTRCKCSMETLIIGEGQARYKGHEIGGKWKV